MKYLIFIITCLILFSCKKDSFITSPDARINITADTLKFDTVFTTVGSVTQKFMIMNQNNQKLNISSIQLAGGVGSAYKIVVDGQAGTQFSNIEMAANDSIYVFVNVTINQSTTNLPFVVSDSILINFNGNKQVVQLQAYGQKANFINNQTITTNTIWNNTLPYVVLGTLTVAANTTLTLQKGTKVYCHATSPIIINGTLLVNGEKDTASRVYFRGDRTDPDYINLPASWPGLLFSATSKNNVLTYAVVQNSYQALVVTGGAGNALPQLTLNQCIIDNAYDIGLYASNSYITATNCLISNCGNNGILGSGGSNIIIHNGGIYNFNFCTMASYSNYYTSHALPVLYIADDAIALTASFKNSIIYGSTGSVDNEVATNKTGGSFNVSFTNVLYRAKTVPTNVAINAVSILNADPLFDSTDTYRHIFDFRLKNNSPAINKGVVDNTVTIDLDGKSRILGGLPDLGCFENQ